MELKILKLKFKLLLEDEARFPKYKGSMIRGGFGSVLRQSACILKSRRKQKCAECLLKEKCAYSFIFETPRPVTSKIMRKYPYIPRPFVLEPPYDDKTVFKKGEIFGFYFILIGKGIEYLPYVVYTFQLLGEKGLGKDKCRYKLQEVSAHGKVIYNDKFNKILNIPEPYKILFKGKKKGIKNIKISFIAPTSIRYRGEITDNVEFHIFYRNLIRRIGLLTYFYGDKDLNIDFKGEIEKAKEIKVKNKKIEWKRIRRYSMRQKQFIIMEGFTGEVEYEGEMDRFMPYIEAGETLHIGRGTSFGMGKYIIQK